MMKRILFSVILITILILSLASALNAGEYIENDPAVRIKELTQFKGVRENQVMGFGLVMGLAGSGDSQRTEFTNRAISNMMSKFNIDIPADDFRMRNVAAVMVTADLPSYANSGSRIDVTVSSMGDARSLEGGILLQTPLSAADNQVYAVAQGSLSTGGYFLDRGTTSIKQNHPTVGIIPHGAIIERSVRSEISRDEDGYITLLLKDPDFTTASRIVEAVNNTFGIDTALLDAQDRVKLSVPELYEEQVPRYMAEVEQLTVRPDRSARVVINERTGTVVMGHNVRISSVAVSHGNLKLQVITEKEVIPPPPFTAAETEIVEHTEAAVVEEEHQLMMVPSGVNLSEVVDALNAVGASSRDIISILQAVDSAGALYGELVIN